MFAIYVGCLIAGIAILLFSLIAGAADHEIHADHDGHLEHDITAWLPFLSLRFWIYFLGAFGLAGVLGMLFHVGNHLLLAIITGAIVGTLVTVISRSLIKRGGSSSSTSFSDLVGQWGTVTVPIRPGQIGKVHINFAGDTMEVQARALDADREISLRERVILVAQHDQIFEVVSEVETSTTLTNS